MLMFVVTDEENVVVLNATVSKGMNERVPGNQEVEPKQREDLLRFSPIQTSTMIMFLNHGRDRTRDQRGVGRFLIDCSSLFSFLDKEAFIALYFSLSDEHHEQSFLKTC